MTNIKVNISSFTQAKTLLFQYRINFQDVNADLLLITVKTSTISQLK